MSFLQLIAIVLAVLVHGAATVAGNDVMLDGNFQIGGGDNIGRCSSATMFTFQKDEKMVRACRCRCPSLCHHGLNCLAYHSLSSTTDQIRMAPQISRLPSRLPTVFSHRRRFPTAAP